MTSTHPPTEGHDAVTLESLRQWLESERDYHRNLYNEIRKQTNPNLNTISWERGKASAYNDVLEIIDEGTFPE